MFILHKIRRPHRVRTAVNGYWTTISIVFISTIKLISHFISCVFNRHFVCVCVCASAFFCLYSFRRNNRPIQILPNFDWSLRRNFRLLSHCLFHDWRMLIVTSLVWRVYKPKLRMFSFSVIRRYPQRQHQTIQVQRKRSINHGRCASFSPLSIVWFFVISTQILTQTIEHETMSIWPIWMHRIT